VKAHLSTLKALCWAALWSAVLTTFIVFAIQSNNRCFLIVNGASWIWMLAIAIWLWFFFFLFFNSNRSRLILIGSSALICLAMPNVDRSPVAVGEASVVGRLRELAHAVKVYQADHPLEGFPSNLPMVPPSKDAAKVVTRYEIQFTTSRSKPGGPVDGFVLQATPLWRECGYVRSFAVTDDNQIHFTIGDRRGNPLARTGVSQVLVA
jgi:hypothetical protein